MILVSAIWGHARPCLELDVIRRVLPEGRFNHSIRDGQYQAVVLRRQVLLKWSSTKTVSLKDTVQIEVLLSWNHRGYVIRALAAGLHLPFCSRKTFFSPCFCDLNE